MTHHTSRGLAPITADPIRITAMEIRIWALAMLVVAFWTNLVRIDSAGGSVSVAMIANSVVSQGAFDVLAWLVLFDEIHEIPTRRGASRTDIWQTILIGVICIVPTRQTVAAAMLLMAMFFLAEKNKSNNHRRIAAILAALAGEIIWTSPYLDFLHVDAGKLDAQIVAAIDRGLGHGVTALSNVIRHDDDAFGITVITQCASSYILAGTAVAFLVTALFRHKILHRSSLVWLLGCFIVSVILTEVRLLLMVQNEAAYDWWHNGPGLSLYSIVAAISAVCFSFAATRTRTRKTKEPPAEPAR